MDYIFNGDSIRNSHMPRSACELRNHASSVTIKATYHKAVRGFLITLVRSKAESTLQLFCFQRALLQTLCNGDQIIQFQFGWVMVVDDIKEGIVFLPAELFWLGYGEWLVVCIDEWP